MSERTDARPQFRLGVALRSSCAADGRTAARWMLERAAAARAAGLDSLFVGDRHVTGRPYLQNTPILGRLLAEWGTGTAGTMFLLPLWNPVLVAEQVTTLAAICEGPFVLQCALGGRDPQFAGMGVSRRERVPRFESAFDVIRRLLAGETVSADGPVPVQGAAIAPVPTDPIEIWIGASATPAIDRAARLGDGWIGSPALSPQEAASAVALYRERCSLHHRPPAAAKAVLRRDVHVGRDRAHAERLVSSQLEARPPGAREAVLLGGPEEVAGQLADLAALGYDEILLRHLADDQREVLASFERLGVVKALVA